MRNIHERIVPGSFEQAGALLAGLGGDDDRLWPSDRWPAMILDRGPAPGSAGGHDRVRYSVEAYEPGRSITFRFAPHLTLVGIHRVDIEDAGAGRVKLRHEIDAQPIRSMRLAWPLVVRWMHDAVIEDLFDGAEAALADRPVERRRLPRWVRTMRAAARIAEARPEPDAELRARRRAADVTTAVLGGIGALHAVWASGVPWPAGDATSLAQSVVGTTEFPSAGATWAVAGLLGAAVLVVQSRVRPGARLAVVPFPLADLGVRVIAGVLALRGAGGLVVSALGVARPTAPFRVLDLAVYSPLCLALAWGTRRTWVGRDAADATQHAGALPARTGA